MGKKSIHGTIYKILKPGYELDVEESWGKAVWNAEGGI